MWARIKSAAAAAAAWVWEWVTVLAALAVAALPPILSELDGLSGLDIAAVLPPEQAAKVVGTVAAVKATVVLALKAAEMIRRRAEARRLAERRRAADQEGAP